MSAMVDVDELLVSCCNNRPLVCYYTPPTDYLDNGAVLLIDVVDMDVSLLLSNEFYSNFTSILTFSAPNAPFLLSSPFGALFAVKFKEDEDTLALLATPLVPPPPTSNPPVLEDIDAVEAS